MAHKCILQKSPGMITRLEDGQLGDTVIFFHTHKKLSSTFSVTLFRTKMMFGYWVLGPLFSRGGGYFLILPELIKSRNVKTPSAEEILPG